MMSPTRAFLATMLLACVSLPATAQSLPEASKKAKEERAQGQQWPLSAAGVPNVSTTADGPASAEGPTNTFPPSADAIFVCKARSMKALFTGIRNDGTGPSPG